MAEIKTETYADMRKRQQKEVNDFPFGFAFSQKQFDEMMVEKFGLKPDDYDKIYSIGGGGYVRKSDSKAMHEMFERHEKELNDAIAGDKTGFGFICDMFDYELSNHEFLYTGRVSDALDALDITSDDLENNPLLKRGLETAVMRQRIRENLNGVS